MSPGEAAAVLAGSYLLGSVSFGYLIVRGLQGRDLRTVGSGNAGATNALRAAGKTAGIAVLALDLGKGAAAVVAARALAAPPPVEAGAAVAVMLGHVFPVFLGFRGGKGVAAAAGALAALAPPVLGLAVLVFLAVVVATRFVSLGSILAAALLPLFVLVCRRLGWVEARGPWLLLAAVAVAAIIIAKHRTNLRRLRAGSELRLGERRPEPALPETGR